MIQLWVRSRAVKNDVGSEDGEPSQTIDLIEAQKDSVERFRQTEATFATMIPEGDRTFDELEEEEKLQLKLDLVETYINITKIYFARSDEESKDMIGKFCNNLFALRFPPKERNSVHIGALELMLTEPGQPHRQGIISKNRLVFIDIFINLIGQYYSLPRE